MTHESVRLGQWPLIGIYATALNGLEKTKHENTRLRDSRMF